MANPSNMNTMDVYPVLVLTGSMFLPDDIYYKSAYKENHGTDVPILIQSTIRNRQRRHLKPDDHEPQPPPLGVELNIPQPAEDGEEVALTAEDFEEKLKLLQEMYVLPVKTQSPSALKEYVYKLFGLEELMKEADYNLNDIQGGYNRNMCFVYNVYLFFARHGKVGDRYKTAETIRFQNMFKQVLGILYYFNHQLVAEYKCRVYADTGGCDEPDLSINRYTPRSDTKLNPLQTLVLYLLNKACTKGYRLYRGFCCRQIYVDQYPTHAWVNVCPVLSFVYGSVDKDTNFEMWQHLTSGNNAKLAAEHLIQAHEKEFPELKPSRHLFSFRDGVYDAKEVKFYPYQDNTLDPNRVSVRFFDTNFDPERLFAYSTNFEDIPTPELDTILNKQNLTPEVKRVIFAMMGRCLYEVGEMDSWEVILFVKGVARSGKSTMGKILQYLYPPHDVGILSSNIEPRFGLSSIFDKLLYLCFEVKASWNLDQGEFQCIISGEEVNIAVKHKTAFSDLWKVPGMLFGNEVARNWLDAAGSLSRRVLVGEFNHQVRDTDTSLISKLKNNIAACLHKMNLAYRSLVNEAGTNNIWNHLPAYFHKTKENLTASINPLIDFLVNNSNIKLDPHSCIPFDYFREMFTQYCNSNSFKINRFNKDFYGSVFEQYAISVVENETREFGGRVYNDIKWIVGVGVKDEEGPINHV